jgi:hypothetical protein
MKKYSLTIEYKKRNAKRADKRFRRRLASKEKRKALRRFISGYEGTAHRIRKINTATRTLNKIIRQPILAPKDFRLIENTQDCLQFFRNIRSEDYISQIRNTKFIISSLKQVEQIDYGTISILTAISDDLKCKKVNLRGDFPQNEQCKQFIIDSGFLNHMFDEHNKPFPKTEKSDLIFFEKGCGILSQDDNIKISKLVKNVVNHLTGRAEYSLSVKTIILEICGNSIEWSGTDNKQWLLGVKYETDKVIFSVTDVGKGILETLYRKFKKRIYDAFINKSDDEILKGAFDKKYGSATQKINRNKGLPSVKANFEKGNILNLKVLTNNVILHFDNDTNSKSFVKGSPRFKGTFYQWEMTENCINKINI